MTIANTAAQALIEALKAPKLSAGQRMALVAALQAATAPASPSPAPEQAAPASAPDRQRGERIKLTKTAVAALPLPAVGERLVYDKERPQLAVRLRPSGRSWIVLIWDRERQRKTTRTLGKCDTLTPDQARAQADRIVGRVADGEDIRRERDDSMTVRRMVADWHAEKSKGTRTADELRDKVLHYLGKLADRPARELEREQVGRVHHDIATKARKRVFKRIDGVVQAVETGDPGLPATADKWRASLSAMFAWAITKGLVTVNPCEGIAQAFDTKKAARTTYLHGQALVRFWKALDDDPDADTRDAIRLLLFTGQRRGNVLTMRWADVDLASSIWTLSAKQTKQSKAQSNPLVGAASVILQRRWESTAGTWVFPATRSRADGTVGPMSESRLRDAWSRICAAAGIEGLRPHDLRHTAGSWLARMGASEAIRQKALGHQTSAMAARYSHLELDPVADAMERSAQAITAAATRKLAPVRKFKGDAS